MVALSLLAAGRYAGLRPTVPSLAWRALTSQPLTSSSSHLVQSRGLKVLAYKEASTAAANQTTKTDAHFHNNAHFSSAAAAALKTPIPYSELSIGKRFYLFSTDRPTQFHFLYFLSLLTSFINYPYCCNLNLDIVCF
jgi:hypothetical protein